MTDTSLTFKYTWADLYKITAPKFSKYPNSYYQLKAQLDEAIFNYMDLTDVEPLPVAALEEASEIMQAKQREFDLFMDWYFSVPKACDACGGPVVAQGEVMACLTCGYEYNPQEIELNQIEF